MKPSHLALFIRSLGADGGGAERNWLILAEEFARQGHRVDLVLGKRSGHFADTIPTGVRVVELGVTRPWSLVRAVVTDPVRAGRVAPALFAMPPPWILGAVPRLAGYLARERPDALLSALGYGNVAALWARERAGTDKEVRVVISERNTLSVRAEQASARRWRVMPEIARRWYPRADAILAVSRGVADDLAATLGMPPERIVVTGNPVVTPDLATRAEEPVDHPWLRAGEPPVVLGVGKLRPQKGFDVLIAAFARARAKRPLRLVILGQGPERARLLQQAKRLGVADDVALPGFVGNPFAWMARCGVFVLSSRFEGLPGVLIQALACGCPVVSTDCPSGPSEILGPGAVAPLVPVEDAAALADAVSGALDAPTSDREKRVARASDYRVERVAPRYLDALLAPATSSRNATSRSATAA